MQDEPVYALVNKGAKHTANGMQDGPVYSLVNKGAKHQTANQNISSSVNKESPTLPTTVYNLAKVLPSNEYYNSTETTMAATVPLPPPQSMKPGSVSADEFGYSFVDDSPLPSKSLTSTPTSYSHLQSMKPALVSADALGYSCVDDSPLPNKSPASTPAAYSHLHQPSPSLTAASATYCTIGDADLGPVYTAYEYVGLPRTGDKLHASSGVSGGTHSDINSFFNLGQASTLYIHICVTVADRESNE